MPVVLDERVSGLGDPADHRIFWLLDSWRRHFADPSAIDSLEGRVGDSITRRQVAEEMKRSARAGFFAAMVWGFGPVGYGAYRTNRILEEAGVGFERALAGILDAAQTSPTAGYSALRAPATRLRFLGPAFGTKLTYFAGLAHGATGGDLPLISDVNTAKAVWHLSGERVVRPVSTLRGYKAYIDLANEWAQVLGVEPDVVEMALFELGGSVGVTWKAWPHAEQGRATGSHSVDSA